MDSFLDLYFMLLDKSPALPDILQELGLPEHLEYGERVVTNTYVQVGELRFWFKKPAVCYMCEKELPTYFSDSCDYCDSFIDLEELIGFIGFRKVEKC